jgi:hypothetical protein
VSKTAVLLKPLMLKHGFAAAILIGVRLGDEQATVNVAAFDTAVCDALEPIARKMVAEVDRILRGSLE